MKSKFGTIRGPPSRPTNLWPFLRASAWRQWEIYMSLGCPVWAVRMIWTKTEQAWKRLARQGVWLKRGANSHDPTTTIKKNVIITGPTPKEDLSCKTRHKGVSKKERLNSIERPHLAARNISTLGDVRRVLVLWLLHPGLWCCHLVCVWDGKCEERDGVRWWRWSVGHLLAKVT